MLKHFLLLLTAFLQISLSSAQTGTLQIYCSEGATVYLNEKFLGKTTADHFGFLAENIPVGETKVTVSKSGFVSQTQTVDIQENLVTEITFELEAISTARQKILGLDLHFGTFGLFNVNNDFTKADYTTGFTPYFDLRLHRNFSLGAEVMCMWGKPQTADSPRMMLCPNIRLNLLFYPFEKVSFHILVASGFTLWPSNTTRAYLTPTLNENRTGWDFRAMAGAGFKLSSRLDLNVNFGYWASSSTSDNIVWITHDSMLISLGPKLTF